MDFSTARTIKDDVLTHQKLNLNYKRNLAQDQTELMDLASSNFKYSEHKHEYWNPVEYSFMYGTPLWDEASEEQRKVLNHLYWVAYYAQIISAEIATIYFNQTSAAGLYALEDFRVVVENLDHESYQERIHIDSFKKIAEEVEKELFGERCFTYPMRSPFVETMIFHNSNRAKQFWKNIQLRFFGMLSSGNAFIGCQYFTIRGVRTLNGKLVQHKLSKHISSFDSIDQAPIPAKISFYHFIDESFHFNTSKIISHDVVKTLKKPTNFEKAVINKAIHGCQRDHSTYSAAINGIFWSDAGLMPVVYKILRSSIFAFNHLDAVSMMQRCFATENQGLHNSAKTHHTAMESYRVYVEGLEFVSAENKRMSLMANVSLPDVLKKNKAALSRFAGRL